MEIMILNEKFESICLIDEFKSLIWTDRYYEAGDFELYIAASSRFLQYIQDGNYAWIKESKHLMVIETIKITTDYDEGDYAIVSGRSLEALLDRRIVWSPTDIQEGTSVQNGVKRLLEENVISPSNDSRKISNLIFVDSDNEYIAGLKFGAQYTGDNLYDVICDICKSFNIGFKIEYYDKYELDGQTLYDRFVFQLYYGEDRTYEQAKNQYVIFSPKFDNILNSSYIETSEKLKNVTLVGGEDNRNTTVVLNKHPYLIDNTPSIYENGMAIEFKNVTAPDTLTTDIYAQNGKFEIDKRLYTDYKIMKSFSLSKLKARASFEKLNKQKVNINGTQYYMESFSASTTSISIRLVGVPNNKIGTLFTNCVNAAKTGLFTIGKKRYGPYLQFDGITTDTETYSSDIRFSKPTDNSDKNTYDQLKLNNKTYYTDKNVNISNTSLSFTVYPYKSNITNPDTVAADVRANNGTFELLKKSYTRYTNFSSMSVDTQDGMKVSLSLSRDDSSDQKYNVTIHGTTYQTTSYSVSTTSLNLSFYNINGINALINNCINHKANITIDGKTYSGYTVVKNYNVSWSDNVCSVSVQFEKPEDVKYVKINNVNYILDSYSEGEDVLSITVKSISNITNLLSDCANGVNKAIVVDGTSYNNYKIFSSYEVRPSSTQSNGSVSIQTVNLQFAKFAEKYPMTINGHTYYVDPDQCSASDNVLSIKLDMDGLDKVEPLIADLKAHNGAYTYDDKTFSGYTELGDITIDNEVRLYDGVVSQIPSISFQVKKPDTDDKKYSQRTLSVYNTQEESAGIKRREMYTDARDISSETDDDVTLTDSEYNEKLKQRGLEKLAQNHLSRYFDGQVESSILFSYEKDFFMGDIVQVENEFGISGTARITEFIRSEDANGFEMYPTFEAINDEE